MVVVIPVTWGSTKWEDYGPARPRQKVRPRLQNNQSKKGWRSGSSGTAGLISEALNLNPNTVNPHTPLPKKTLEF
jgi:hypothetical protein